MDLASPSAMNQSYLSRGRLWITFGGKIPGVAPERQTLNPGQIPHHLV